MHRMKDVNCKWRTERSLWLLLFFLQLSLLGILMVIIQQSEPLYSMIGNSITSNSINKSSFETLNSDRALDIRQQKILLDNFTRIQNSFDEYKQFISRGHKTLREFHIILVLIMGCSVILSGGIFFCRRTDPRKAHKVGRQ